MHSFPIGAKAEGFARPRSRWECDSGRRRDDGREVLASPRLEGEERESAVQPRTRTHLLPRMLAHVLPDSSGIILLHDRVGTRLERSTPDFSTRKRLTTKDEDAGRGRTRWRPPTLRFPFAFLHAPVTVPRTSFSRTRVTCGSWSFHSLSPSHRSGRTPPRAVDGIRLAEGPDFRIDKECGSARRSQRPPAVTRSDRLARGTMSSAVSPAPNGHPPPRRTLSSSYASAARPVSKENAESKIRRPGRIREIENVRVKKYSLGMRTKEQRACASAAGVRRVTGIGVPAWQ